MNAARKMTRHELADAIALDRVEYERLYAHLPAGWQPLRHFCRDAAVRIAKGERGVQGITVHRGDYGVSYTARIDWKKLAAVVERRLPDWHETVARSYEKEAASAAKLAEVIAGHIAADDAAKATA